MTINKTGKDKCNYTKSPWTPWDFYVILTVHNMYQEKQNGYYCLHCIFESLKITHNVYCIYLHYASENRQ